MSEFTHTSVTPPDPIGWALAQKDAELAALRADLAKAQEQNAALAAALEREIGLKTYFSGRADGLWTCYRCGSIGQHDQIIHKPECTVGTLQGSVAILARVRAEAKAEELERLSNMSWSCTTIPGLIDTEKPGKFTGDRVVYKSVKSALLQRAAEIRRGEAPDAK
jgi:hypothetical protein